MNKEILINKEVSDALHCLFHCARKDSNYETQYQQFKLVYDYINQLERTLDVVEVLLKKYIQDINQKIDFEIDMGLQGDYQKQKNFEETIRILKTILNEVGGSNE